MDDRQEDHESLKGLAEETRAIWEKNAAFWDEYMGEGGLFQRYLIGPATDRLLQLQPDELVLDIACGNGAYARRMAAFGARVVACDSSQTFLARARERTQNDVERIEYRLLDATDEGQLATLGPGPYDAAVCTMAIMDIPVIAPLLAALRRLLTSNGRFVFSITHPCFNTNGTKKLVEEEDRDGDIVITHAVRVSRYDTLGTVRGLGVVGQPVSQYYFNRTLSRLFGACFAAGFALDGLEEPVFPAEVAANQATSPAFAWQNFREIPPVLVARLRPTGQPQEPE